jgi:hypothetical protein
MIPTRQFTSVIWFPLLLTGGPNDKRNHEQRRIQIEKPRAYRTIRGAYVTFEFAENKIVKGNVTIVAIERDDAFILFLINYL